MSIEFDFNPNEIHDKVNLYEQKERELVESLQDLDNSQAVADLLNAHIRVGLGGEFKVYLDPIVGCWMRIEMKDKPLVELLHKGASFTEPIRLDPQTWIERAKEDLVKIDTLRDLHGTGALDYIRETIASGLESVGMEILEEAQRFHQADPGSE